MPLLHRPRPAPPVSTDAAAVRDALTPLLQLVGPPDQKPVPAARRRALAGRIFLDAPRLSRAVARGLQARPELFPDVPIGGAALAALQAQADAWRELRDALRYLHEQATDRFLLAQAASADQALAVLRQVDESAALPFACGLPDPEERETALGEALVLLRRRQRAQRQSGLKARRSAADASSKGRRPAPASSTRRSR